MNYYNLKKTTKGYHAIAENGDYLFVKKGTPPKDMKEGGPYASMSIDDILGTTMKGLTLPGAIDITMTHTEARMYEISTSELERRVTRVSINLLCKEERISIIAASAYIFSHLSEEGRINRYKIISNLVKTLEAKYRCDVMVGLIEITHFSVLAKQLGTLRAHFNYGEELEDFYPIKNANTKIVILDDKGKATKTAKVIKELF